jgi:hypothetical protein
MKKEGMINAVIGSIIAGAALGTGFLIAQKYVGKSMSGKSVRGIKEDAIIVETRPSVNTAEMSNMVGTSLVGASNWSNARGVTSSRSGVGRGGINCFNPQTGAVYNGGVGCSGGLTADAARIKFPDLNI